MGIMIVQDSTVWNCSLCGFTAKSKKVLHTHLIHDHGGEDIRKYRECPYSGCGKKYQNPTMLRMHIEKHHQKKEPECVCKECGKRFQAVWQVRGVGLAMVPAM